MTVIVRQALGVVEPGRRRRTVTCPAIQPDQRVDDQANPPPGGAAGGERDVANPMVVVVCDVEHLAFAVQRQLGRMPEDVVIMEK